MELIFYYRLINTLKRYMQGLKQGNSELKMQYFNIESAEVKR